jgi:hypothetical protein
VATEAVPLPGPGPFPAALGPAPFPAAPFVEETLDGPPWLVVPWPLELELGPPCPPLLPLPPFPLLLLLLLLLPPPCPNPGVLSELSATSAINPTANLFNFIQFPFLIIPNLVGSPIPGPLFSGVRVDTR